MTLFLLLSRVARCAALAVVSTVVLQAQGDLEEDLRAIRSPDGQYEMQVFVGQPVAEGMALLPRFAYRVNHGGRRLLATSFLGFEMKEANPLGEKPGLTRFESGAATDAQGPYNWAISHFLQNGSQGRLYDLEYRAYNSGVAFRYHIPWSAPLSEILIENENTEFHFPEGTRSAATNQPIADLDTARLFALPFVAQIPNVGFVSLSQTGIATSTADDGKVTPAAYTAVSVQHDTSSLQGPTMTTRMARHPEKPWLAVESKPKFTTPWRIISFAPSQEALRPPNP